MEELKVLKRGKKSGLFNSFVFISYLIIMICCKKYIYLYTFHKYLL